MRRLMLTAIALLTGASSSLAQGHMGTPQEQQACTRDAQRLCRKQLGDDNAVQQCLQQNRTKLSKSCQKVFQSTECNERVPASGGNRIVLKEPFSLMTEDSQDRWCVPLAAS